jgi:hypothetical protein
MTTARLELYVEGLNDRHALSHLMRLHGAGDYSLIGDPPPGWPRYHDRPRGSERSVEELIASISPLVLAGSDPLSTLGFVVDADDDPLARWSSIRDRLSLAGVQTPGKLSRNGFIGISTDGCRVGVWVMPNNGSSGGLEAFLLALIPTGDSLRSYAAQATVVAKRRGAPFKDAHMDKARIHTWLAWQDEPGHPFGTALKTGVFDHHCELAQRFANWFKTLYEIG